ncbi:YrbL family protein [Ketobacter sp.]|uniref:YrbL family protein n=1 Tax=Ketobacter sp. TaxID=2083498 RepID=UPI000F26F093|nr:YrbL family protein [Ketobacter sp.]RLU01361.1 MAG: hypothetical protein D9N14_03230 [Ketobacter sp.]
MTLPLSTCQPFAKGGNRLCFVHPEDPARCIKVRRPDFTLEDLRRAKGFPKNLRPLASFDDNQEEHRVMQALHRRYGEVLYQHVSHCYGFVDTDLGPGLVSELVRNDNGRIAYSLKQQLAETGLSDDLNTAIDTFCAFWEWHCIPSRQLLTHNVVVQCDANDRASRLVMIDGLGDSTLIPGHWLPLSWQRKRYRQKTRQFHQRIDTFLTELKAGKQPSEVGKLIHDGSQQ